MHRPMWLWNTYQVVSCPTTIIELLAAANQALITDFYLCMDASHYYKHQEMIRMFNAASCAASIRVWALEGGRVHFSDADGPTYFYQNIEDMISFNTHREWTSFHNGIKDSDLDSTPGTGIWKETQAADRSTLIRDWVTIHDIAKTMLNRSGLRLAAAFPHWTCDYFGEPLQVQWPDENSPLRRVMELLMENVDDYVVMSYHTDPANAAAGFREEAEYATDLRRTGDQHRRRVLAAVETTQGIGAPISYGDDSSKCSKIVVLNDVEAIIAALGQHDAFGGVAIHAWSSWCKMAE